mgnify:FL=1
MRIFRLYVTFTLVIAGVVSTVGSGGGGGGGLGFPDTGDIGTIEPPPLPPEIITIANAQAVAATVIQDAGQALDFAATIGGQIFPSLPSAPDLLSSHSKFELLATVAAIGEPVTEKCGADGTVTVSGYPENDPVSLSEKDAFDLVFNACDDGDGYALDGSFSLIMDQLLGDPRTDVFNLSYELRFVTVAVTFDEDTRTASLGSLFRLTWDSTEFPVTVLSLTPYVLELTSQTDVYSLLSGVHSQTVSADISVTTTLVEVGEAQLVSRSNGGSVVYETIVPLRAPDGQDAESGEILISQLFGNGSIHIVIESSTSVRLDIDLDGDGTVDDSQYTTWVALRG